MSRLGSRIGKMLGKFHREKPASLSLASPGARTIPENRPLNLGERALIEWLLAHGTPEAAAYAHQLEGVRVVGRCGCGCPTVDLAVGDAQLSTTGPSRVLADFFGVTPDGIEVGVILHARQDTISELEVYSLGTTDTTGRTFGLPNIESLKALE
jgi:hypothetical protein